MTTHNEITTCESCEIREADHYITERHLCDECVMAEADEADMAVALAYKYLNI